QLRMANATNEFNEAKEQTRTLRNEAKKKADRTPELETKWAELPGTLDEIDQEIENHTVRIAAISHNPGVMDKYRQREQEINKLRETLENHEQSLQQKQERITSLKENWLPRIHEFVTQIDHNFSTFFQEIGCVGNVKLHEDGDNFASYGIDIMVSYR